MAQVSLPKCRDQYQKIFKVQGLMIFLDKKNNE